MRERLSQYITEHVSRMMQEEPTGAAQLRQAWGVPVEVRMVPLRGGALGILTGYFTWLRARYSEEAEGTIQTMCVEMGFADEGALLAALEAEQCQHRDPTA
jgi:hypothetical protein